MNKLRKLGHKGFTIVELLIVIVVIGLLAALVFVQFNNMQARARDAERKADLRLIESKLAEYNADNGQFPEGDDISALAVISPGIPEDALEDPLDGQDYGYESEDGLTYTLTATLERLGDGETNPYTRTGGGD